MYITILYIIIAIIIFDYLLSLFLDYLNTTKWSSELPSEVQGIYDEEEYKKSQNYQRENMKISNIKSTISTALILLILIFGGFGYIDEWLRNYTQHPVWLGLLFFGVLGFASDIFSTPFDIYDTFVIEEKYGFNTTTVRTYILDKIKGWILGALLGGGILGLIIWFYQSTGEMFWIYCWIIVTAFTLFIAMFYSRLIVPLFNKQTPLEEGELRKSIEDFSKKEGFKLKNIYKIDGSKRSTKANAYFSGLGPQKRIVLFDTLINDLKNNEIVAVLSHEIGHFIKKHTAKGMTISVVQLGVTFFLLSLFINNPALSNALGANIPSFHIGVIAFGILYSPISTILGLGMNILSRKNEYEADRFARDHYEGEALIDALKKLSKKNLSNLTPHPLYVFFNYSHPPLLKRIKALRNKL